MPSSSSQIPASAAVQGERENNRGGKPETIQDLAVALMEKGISPTVAKRLASHYTHEHILEKIEYLEYLQETNPDGVKRPAGWLRRAIEEDYSRPDGVLRKAERETQEKTRERQRQHDAHTKARRIIQEAAKRAREEKKCAAHLEAIKRQYQTSEREEHVWLKIVSHLVAIGPIQTRTYLTGSHLVSFLDHHAVLWFPQRYAQQYIRHRFSFTIQRLLARHLNVDFATVTLTFVTPDQELRQGMKERSQI